MYRSFQPWYSQLLKDEVIQIEFWNGYSVSGLSQMIRTGTGLENKLDKNQIIIVNQQLKTELSITYKQVSLYG